jgi:acetolactate synthase-1/3 small subunit
MSKHTLSVLVENKPGVLARVAGLFSRRGFNIDSLAVGPTEHDEVSRMTIVVDVAESPLEQVTKQLNKLVEVIKIVELDPAQSVARELLLVKVRADAATRGQVLELVQVFRARPVGPGRDRPGIPLDHRPQPPPGPRARATRRGLTLQEKPEPEGEPPWLRCSTTTTRTLR